VLPCSHMLTTSSSQLLLWCWMRFIGNDPTEEHTKHKLFTMLQHVIYWHKLLSTAFLHVFEDFAYVQLYKQDLDYWTLLFNIMPTFTVLCINLLFLICDSDGWCVCTVWWNRNSLYYARSALTCLGCDDPRMGP
jgi:hypothetical protein